MLDVLSPSTTYLRVSLRLQYVSRHANVYHNPFSAYEHFVLSRIYFEAGIFGGASIHAKQSN